MKVVHFEQKYYEELLAFSKKTWPHRSEEYLGYRLFRIPERDEDNRYNLLVINDDGKIVGCALYLPTKARIFGKEEFIKWSHDLFIEEQYRGAAGLMLLIEMNKVKSTFGFGTTPISYQIQKELGTKFIGKANYFLVFNIWSFKLPLVRLNLIGNPDHGKFKFPAKLKVGKNTFNKVSNASELKIPNNGYWSDDSVDIDFIRDEHFIRNRFFENFNNYYFYNLEVGDPSSPGECYFVIRPVIKKRFLILSIIDFRFNLKKHEQFEIILKAASKLGRINRLPFIAVLTSYEYKRFNLYPLIIRRDPQCHIITYLPVTITHPVFVTCADSDADFLDE